MVMQLYSRQVMRALASLGGEPIDDETVNWLTRRGVLIAAPVGRRGLYARSETFILRAALELTRLGVTASHLTGMAHALREILTAGEEFGIVDPGIEEPATAPALSPAERELLDKMLKRVPVGAAGGIAPADSHVRVQAWRALERARLGQSDALVLFWTNGHDSSGEWQVRSEGTKICGPAPTNIAPQRRAFLALDWANISRGI